MTYRSRLKITSLLIGWKSCDFISQFFGFSQLKIFLDINGLFNFAYPRIPHASADSRCTAAFVDRQFVCYAFHRHFFQAGYVFSFEHFFPVRIVRTAGSLAFTRSRYDHVAFKYRKRKKYRRISFPVGLLSNLPMFSMFI